MESFILIISILIIIIGTLGCVIVTWVLITHRETRYNNILDEHKQQVDRVKKKLGVNSNNDG